MIESNEKSDDARVRSELLEMNRSTVPALTNVAAKEVVPVAVIDAIVLPPLKDTSPLLVEPKLLTDMLFRMTSVENEKVNPSPGSNSSVSSEPLAALMPNALAVWLKTPSGNRVAVRVTPLTVALPEVRPSKFTPMPEVVLRKSKTLGAPLTKADVVKTAKMHAAIRDLEIMQ